MNISLKKFKKDQDPNQKMLKFKYYKNKEL